MQAKQESSFYTIHKQNACAVPKNPQEEEVWEIFYFFLPEGLILILIEIILLADLTSLNSQGGGGLFPPPTCISAMQCIVHVHNYIGYQVFFFDLICMGGFWTGTSHRYL